MSSFRIFKLLVAVLVLSALITAPGLRAQNEQPKSSPVSEVVNGNSQFALALYQNINADKASTGQNIFVSPYSISTALAMTYAGSRNNTQKQMASALHFNLPEDKLQTGFSSLLAQTKATSAKHYKLEVGNAIWGQTGFHFEPVFASAVSKYYGGGFNVVNFVDAGEASRARISKFKADKTKNDRFIVSPGQTVNVPMMRQTGHFPFMQNDELQMIELPYAGDDLSMIAILPQGDIEKFGATLSLAQLQELRKSMRSQEVNLFLPRFKFEARYLLEQYLKAMGMPDAFDENKADFSGMTGKPDLCITHVIHQAMIDVNEEGSEAAAATAVVMGLKSVSMPATFRADKPFIFMIVHKPTDSILFMGRVSNPPASAPAATSGE
jgi:serpin B